MLQYLAPAMNLLAKRDAIRPDHHNVTDVALLTSCTGVAWAWTVELDIMVLLKFRKRGGLYFWSLLISSWGCSIHAFGFILNYLLELEPQVYLPFIFGGWVMMTTGQAFVLYSRLHLVIRKKATLRFVLCMIIFNAFALHGSTIVTNSGANSNNNAYWQPKFDIVERVQLAGFCLQEFIIATLYIVATVRMLGSIYHSLTRKVMWELITINSICIGLDIILIGLEYSGQYVAEVSVKPALYIIKLKLEFIVLNQLMGITKAGLTNGNKYSGGANHQPNHELHNRTLLSDPDHKTGQPRNGGGSVGGGTGGNWSTAKASRGSMPGHGSTNKSGEIYKTQQVDVIREVNVETTACDESVSSTATANGGQDRGAKVNSLMGTPIVMAPSWTTKPPPDAKEYA